MKSVRIHTLTGLRAIAILTIFCSHLNYLVETSFHGFYSLIDNGRLGVSFFLVLSGFVLALGYSNKVKVNDISQDLQFVKKRIRKIYIPYFITMILAIPLYFLDITLWEGSVKIKLFISHLIINAGMIQSVIPFAKYSTSINGVSWFISTIFIIYLFTPGILRLNNKTAKTYNFLKQALLIIAILFLYCCLFMLIREIEYIRFADLGLSIIYINPLIRLFPFLLGIIVYNIYSLLDNYLIKNGSFAEILGLGLFLGWWIIADRTGLPTVMTECIDMLVSMTAVLIFSLSRQGIVSVLLSKEKMLKLGGISLDFYLIHYLIINYGMIAAKHFYLDKGIAVLPLTIMFFVLSLCGAYMIHLFTGRLLSAVRTKKQI